MTRYSVLLLAFLCTSCARTPDSAKQWDTFVATFLESHFAANPSVAVYVGRHDFDGKLPDWSKAGINKEIERLRTARNKARAFDPNALDEERKFERNYVIAVIDGQLFWTATAEWPFKNPTFYDLDPNVYVAREYAPLEQRMKGYVAYARAVPRAMSQIQANLRTPMPRVHADIGRLTFGGLADYYAKDVPGVFAGTGDAHLQADFKEANEGAIQAAKQLDAWFAEQQKSAAGDYAMGAKLFSEMLRTTEAVDVPLEKIEQVGREDMDRNLAALKEACAQFTPGKTINQCVDKANANKPQPGPVEEARKQLVELKAFVAEKGLVSIPGTEEAKVDESPPFKRYNFAYMDPAGPYEKGVPSIY